MNRRLLYAVPLLVLLALALVFVMRILDPEAGDRTLRPMLGKPVPALELPVLGDPGRQVSPQDFAGSWLLVNLWGSWCAPCRQEHGELMRISREEDVPLLGINTWDTYEAAQGFLAELGDPFDVVGFDVDGEARLEFAVTGVPETLLVDPNGLVVVHHIGPLSAALFEQAFREHVPQ
ncbi:MAG: redoxin domain-containing protein [Gammaproteobacteria bacterium]|nr:redoxin domain-containing protein [Gammaproteobacteria bacterium]MCY4322999.1 redoxin domain-containing protein [Gammaproteobacteria bacterium]